MLRILLFLLMIFSISIEAQTPRIDSLKLLLEQKKFSSENHQLEAVNHLFDEFYYLQNDEQSLQYANLLVEHAQKLNNVGFLRQGKLNQALMRLKVNQEEGRMMIEKLLEEVIEAEDVLLEGQCYLYLGIHQFNELLLQEDCSYFEKAQKKLQQVNSIKEIIAIIYVAQCIKEKVGYPIALAMIEEVYSKIENSPNTIIQIQVLRNILFYQYQLDNHKDASETAFKLIKIATDNNYYTGGLIHAYSIAIDLLVFSNKIEEALKYAELSYQASKKINDNIAKARAATILASNYITHVPEKHNEAEELLKYSINIAKKSDLIRREYTALYTYGSLYEKKGDNKKAMEKYLEGLSVLESSSEANKRFGLRLRSKITSLINSDSNLADLHTQNFIFSQTDTINLYPKMLFNQIKKNMALSRKDFKEAYFFLEKEMKDFNKLANENHKINLNEIILKNNLENEKQENKKNLELLNKSKINNYLFTLISILFVGFLVWLFRTNKKKTKLNNKIVSQNKEIQSLNNLLNEKNDRLARKNVIKNKELMDFSVFKAKQEKELQEIKIRFEELSNKKNLKPKDFKLIKSRITNLQSEEENDWISFKERVEESNPDFFTLLTTKHPNLTEKDKFHCGYVLIGMSVAAVAEISFVSKTTVHSSRYRIKKKLGIDKELKLKDYFNQIMQKV